MKPFYSIIQVLIRPAIREYISIGLLFGREGEKPFLAFADDKIKAAKGLLTKESGHLLTFAIEDLRANLEPQPTEFQFSLIASEPSASYQKNTNFTSGFIDYLSRYQNNLIRFSTPVDIDCDFGQTQFQKLFSIYISLSKIKQIDSDLSKEGHHVQSRFEKLERDFYPRIANRINHDYRITKQVLPTLPQPQTVDLIGRNGNVVVGKEINFLGYPSLIGKQTSDLYALIKAFEFNNETDGTYFVIGEEPPKEDRKRWELWETIVKADQIQFVDVDETDQIVDFIETHDVKPIAIQPFQN